MEVVGNVWQALETCKCCRSPGSKDGWLADIVSRNWDEQLWYMETVLRKLIEIGEVPLSTCLTGFIVHQTLPVDFSLNYAEVGKFSVEKLRHGKFQVINQQHTVGIPILWMCSYLNVISHPPINWCRIVQIKISNIYITYIWGAIEPQNFHDHRVVMFLSDVFSRFLEYLHGISMTLIGFHDLLPHLNEASGLGSRKLQEARFEQTFVMWQIFTWWMCFM